MSEQSLAIVTPSYSNDFELVRDLCKSLDEYVTCQFKHFLIVPACDLSMFSELAAANRVVLSKESILRPHGFFKLPLPRRIRIPGIYDKRPKEQWYCRGVGRVSGWLIQQLIKLSAPEYTKADVLMFTDSDVLLFRKLGYESLFRDGLLRLSQKPITQDMHSHLEWHANALEILGLGRPSGPKFNYIGQLITWRRELLIEMQSRIARIWGEDWRIVLARKKAVSEYILYGLFVEMASSDHGHVFDQFGLTCSFWTGDEEHALESMAKCVLPEHTALHIQSTIPMSIESRRRIFNNLIVMSAA